ncbi:hypothetical protein [Verminephrobacter eiseniae]|uniref:hypothetical protein n=1 Tax=Verminephrobacter eiseniae TaxID=364317 RepID=UPI00030061E8|nr:hypothetical protein [Verminephrobacter eiseniae]MCW5283425.1 hypothetical protein [Verminephrobacter eiseniae]MCW5301134.1 hypothetical protein [Verminephrobacter eiseniae]MCW8178612.1 hypothetical protein [Verminephrobacter eiseniae]MCW8190224.1 hypothetical protein [Verminephrobacter eiseniae]
MSAARPPEGAHTAAEGEGTPVRAARPPEGAHTAAGGAGAPVRAACVNGWPGGVRRCRPGDGCALCTLLHPFAPL